jgi:MFS family permease
LKEDEQMNLKQKKLNWTGILVVAACFCMGFVCLGFCSSNKSLYLGAITEALGIKRSLFSINDSCRYVSTAIVNLFFGTLIAKFGPRKLVAAGFLSLIASTLIYATANHVAVFYLGGMFLGIGLSWCTTTMVSYLVGKWYPEKRGTITGFALCANGLGGALAAQIVTPIIYEQGNPFGYRNAYYLVAILLAVTGVIATILVKEPKESQGTAAKKKSRGKSWTGITLAEALRKPYFYGAAICVFVTGMGLQGITGIAGTHLKDVGIDKGLVATILSTHSVVLCGSKFLAGFSYDKLGLRKTLLICEFCGVCSFVALALSGSSSAGTALAFAWSALAALSLPLETVLVPLIAADLFGDKEFAKIMGIFVSVNTAGFAFGTPTANAIFDIFGTYTPALYIIAGAMLAIMVGFWFIINASEKEKKKLVAVEENEV